MGTPRLREIKREIRVLGLASMFDKSTDHHETVGVLYRGRHWLDGVLRTRSKGPDVTEDAAEMIRCSKHYPQIRVILLQRELNDGAEIDPKRLSEATLKPVIALEPPGGETPPISEEPSFTAVGLGVDTARKVLRVASREGGCPEALRVAEVLKESFRWNWRT